MLFNSCGITWTEAGRRASGYREVIQWLDPDLIDEIEGIALGAGLKTEDILALNCRTEILPSSLFNIEAGKTAELSECTAIAVSSSASADGHTWLAQNWDWLGRQRDALVVLQTRDSRGTDIATLTEGGMLAKIGLNDKGMAVGLNILRTIHDGVRPGVPVHALLRHALSHESLAMFRKRLAVIAKGPGFSAGSNIPSADASGDVGSFELSPDGWAEHRASDGVVVHTNHFLCSPLVASQAERTSTLSTESRLRCASTYSAKRPVSVSAIEGLLRDESDGFISVCRRPDPSLPEEVRWESVAGVRIDCTAKRWWIAPNIPTLVDFQEILSPHAQVT
jgi:isopenicillin-N N-acyltransferase-like protein